MLYILLFIMAFGGSSGFEDDFEADEDDTYATENRLFHIERSKNKNIVCYDLNADDTGVPNDKKPLTVYWINREKYPGRRGELSFIQEKLAYGYTVIRKQEGRFYLELNATKNREITLESREEKYICRIDINSQPAALQKIYVKSKQNNSLQVEYVEIQGIDLATGVSISERFYP